MNTAVENIPVVAVTAAEMKRVDEALQDAGMSVLQVMELIGFHAATLVRLCFAKDDIEGKHVVVFAGKGNNGAGGCAVARHLANLGADVKVIKIGNWESTSDSARAQMKMLEAMNVTVYSSFGSCEVRAAETLIVDAILGYSIEGELRGEAYEAVQWINRQACKVLSLDMPTGLCPDTGFARGDAVVSDATMTLALPKMGLLNTEARHFVHRLFLVDIGIPEVVFRKAGVVKGRLGAFLHESIVRLY